MALTPRDGPDQLFRYVLVRVAQRLEDDETLGVLLLEPSLKRAAFLWADGTYRAVDLPSSLEVQRAFEDATAALAERGPTRSTWLGGIVQAFDTYWGLMTVIESRVYELVAGGEEDAARQALLRTGLDARP